MHFKVETIPSIFLLLLQSGKTINNFWDQSNKLKESLEEEKLAYKSSF